MKKRKDVTLHEAKLLHKLLQESLAIGHKKREDALITCVQSVLLGSRLTVTDIGRHAVGQAFVKHKIKQSDRLLANPHLYKERIGIYRSTLKYLVQPLMKVLIDWSEVQHHGYPVLRASIYAKGRSFTLYEEVHAEKLLGNSDIQKSLLGPKTHLIIITDAGFKTDFFQAILSLNWDFIIRIRSNRLFKKKNQPWIPCPDFYPAATSTPHYLGEGLLSKSTKTLAHFYLYQGYKPEGKIKKRRKNATQSKLYSKRHRQPWLIASSFKKPAQWITTQYKKRMKIEHEFRDLKDQKWGLGLKQSKSKGVIRLSSLLLIAHLACFLLWCIGLWAEQEQFHYRFQSSSQSSQQKLSLVFLGSLIIQYQPFRHLIHALFENISSILQIAMKEGYHEV